MVVPVKNPYPRRAPTTLVVSPPTLGVTDGCEDTDGLMDTEGLRDGCTDTDGASEGVVVGWKRSMVGNGVKEGKGVMVGRGVNVGNGVTEGKNVGSKVGKGQ